MNAAARDVANTHWVLFALDAGRYALPLDSVERIVRAAAVTSLPLAPPTVLGALDVEGRILPVFDLRERFGLPRRPISPADQFILVRGPRRRVVLAVDAALGVNERGADLVQSAALAPGLAHVHGIFADADGLVLIHDLEQLLSADEEAALDAAMHAEEGRRAR